MVIAAAGAEKERLQTGGCEVNCLVRKYRMEDLEEMRRIWNAVVESADAFPQEEVLSMESAEKFFESQSFTGVAESDGRIVGLYILHPNNIGRCGHLANASYAVDADVRGCRVGEALVRHSLREGRQLGFRVLQFNAVVKSNVPALALYRKLGFSELGSVPGGFRRKDGSFEDIVLFYHLL